MTLVRVRTLAFLALTGMLVACGTELDTGGSPPPSGGPPPAGFATEMVAIAATSSSG